jgi:hypothetical protein
VNSDKKQRTSDPFDPKDGLFSFDGSVASGWWHTSAGAYTFYSNPSEVCDRQREKSERGIGWSFKRRGGGGDD